MSEIVDPGTKVLDLGCGEGELSNGWRPTKGCRAAVWRSPAPKSSGPSARGVSVFQSDIEQALADYPDQAFDYVILSQTLQETFFPRQVLQDMLRVGRRGIVAFPNFGHWTVRASLLISGRAPRTRLFPYDRYESPNIHFLTVQDFDALVRPVGRAERGAAVISARHRKVTMLPNLMAEVAVYLVRR